MLAGITRHHLLALPHSPYPVVAGTVTLAELAQAKEAFLTSTTRRIMPVVQIDDVVIGTGKPGPVTLALLDALIQLEERQVQVLADSSM